MTDMPSVRLSETALIQNETLGAFALWKFGLAFQEREAYPASLPLAFLVLPLVLHGPSRQLVLSTQKVSGLHLFVGKLGEKRENLLLVHSRALALRQLTLESLMWAEKSNLLKLDPPTAKMWAVDLYDRTHPPALPERIRNIGPACERLGYWFSGLTDHQIAQALKVEF